MIAVECCDDPAFYKLIGSYGDGMLIESQFGAYTDPIYMASIQKYYDDFYAMHGQAPGFMGASTYDAFYIAKDAIERAGTVDKAAVRDCNRNHQPEPTLDDDRNRQNRVLHRHQLS